MFVDRLASVAILGLRLIDVVRIFTPGEEFDMSVNVDKKDRLLTITWDQPPLNVLDIVLLRELDEILR